MNLNKDIIIDILYKSFESNPSVNFVIGNKPNKAKRLKLLLEYSYFLCQKHGKIYLSQDKNSCALVLFPHTKTNSLKSILWDIKLAFTCIGISNLSKVMNREKEIKKHHPKTNFAHLWYIGVLPNEQGKGQGSALLHEIMKDCQTNNLPIYLETSNPINFTFYEKHGFKVHAELASLNYNLKMFVKG